MKIRRVLLALILTIAAAGYLYTQQQKIRLAVIPFDDTVTSLAENEKAGTAASSLLEKSFMEVDRFYVRPADALRDYIRSLELVQVGLQDPSSITGKGSSLQVDYLTVGTVSRIGSRYEVDARTVNINNWSIVHTHGTSAGSMDQAMEDITWYIEKEFTRKYLSSRVEADRDISTVSVFKFRDANSRAVNDGYSGLFSEILNSQLGSCTGITTIERKYAWALINEKVLEMAGIVENDRSDDSLQMGGIGYKVEGDIRVFSDVICVNYKLHRTSDGVVVSMGTTEVTSPSALRPAARGIANTIEEVLGNRAGTVVVISSPSGAQVTIDGRSLGKTPLTVPHKSGKYHVKVVLNGYEAYKADMVINPQTVNKYAVELKKKAAEKEVEEETLVVTSSPSGAEVIIDGKSMGRTPLKAVHKKGTFTMEVELKGHEIYEAKITVNPNAVKKYAVTLKKAAAPDEKAAKESAGPVYTAGKIYIIGDRGPAGGWVIYDKGNYSDGWRYLEAAPTDQSDGAKWGCYGTSIPGAKGTAVGTGKSNTQAIVNICGEENIAAKVCTAYRGGGKNDWFLPSKNELGLIYKNLKRAGVGGFAGFSYWSSSDGSDNDAWYQGFANGFQYGGYKGYGNRVRAVRAF